MKDENVKKYLLPAAAVLSIGLVLGGFFIGNGVYNAGNKRIVSVKGLAERDAVADMAVWNINISKVGGDLSVLQTQVDSDIIKIKKFLVDSGFSDYEIQNTRVQVRDNFAGYDPIALKENMSSDKNQSRYIIEAGVMVRSNNVNMVDNTSRRMGELVRQGITIKEDYTGPIYVFNGLNDIKISMIEQATKNAGQAAQQFAKDADAKLGPIQSATQGIFSIEPRDPVAGYNNDEKQSIYKKIRVVSTISFYLK